MLKRHIWKLIALAGFAVGAASYARVNLVKPATATTRKEGKPAIPITDYYKLAVDRAMVHGEEDQLTKKFHVEDQFSFVGTEIGNLGRLTVTPGGQLVVLDTRRRLVSLFDGKGQFLHPIGKTGLQPGSYTMPSGLAAFGDEVAVSDFKSERVHIFSTSGEFRRSFIYSPQRFSSTGLVVDASKRFYLFGNRWDKALSNGNGARMVHTYSPSGEFQSSNLPVPEWAVNMNLTVADAVEADVAGNDVYLVFPFDYTIYRVKASGEVETVISQDALPFRKPLVGLTEKKLGSSDQQFYFNNWTEHWTPMRHVAVLPGNVLAVQYQTFGPLRFVIDFWSLKTRRKLDSINTNHLLLAHSADGALYFLYNVEKLEQKRYDVLRAKFQN